ncbi:hypothetical protein ABQZ99_006005 [Xanthomonas hortorum pv. vitians]|uniref:DUF2007 domain-containing protein n=3 Tax=Xanthomonas hortorum TaxID=56454 RepID=A0AAW8ZKW4_9XANT|nr:hypothetical protein [Xanthomonas hortorum]MCC8495410.1 hypothetical protein [Xanthomonas hortorum pv. gardneri]MCC8497289.1 hypothetical protein [Xanthomonas hortorum pv. gardneri]MCC8506056.1 hypothetical protein [Xanthomonas hortorum pv. gardneri]MCC8510627.1 hypothetical protein [Xanthomonas hortorum pv. gardneri]MCC8519190.1 hypothetical protein [Xanthomonas hortorum pv. gardneri]
MALFYRQHRRGRMPASFMAGGARGPQGPPVPFGRHANRVPSATPIGVWVADSKTQKESSMSYDTQEMPVFAARQVAHHFDLTAIVFEWNCADSLNVTPSLEGIGTPIHFLTPADVDVAIVAVDGAFAEAQR